MRSLTVSALLLCLAQAIAAQPVPENVDLSGTQPDLAAAVPVVAVEPGYHGRVAVIWRFIDPIGGAGAHSEGNWVCHLSISLDHGKTFRQQVLDWHTPAMARCNAPWVGFSSHHSLYIAATLTGDAPAPAMNSGAAASAPMPMHPDGEVGFASSHDGGRTWTATQGVIASHSLESFATDESISEQSKQTPWDGARGAIDTDGSIYLSGAFPAPPGAPLHSQRFYSASSDAGKTFGPIRAFSSALWPERWDGDIAAANGEFIASYIAESTPNGDRRCLCVVVAISHDGGVSVQRHLVAAADEFDLDTLVHYPPVAADPSHRHRFALALIAANKAAIAMLVTADDGERWSTRSPQQPRDVVSVSRPAIAFTPDGVLVLAWRGVHADGSYDIYAAAVTAGGGFGTSVRISTQSSNTPERLLKTYAVRGDFHTSVAADRRDAHLAWADARGGSAMRVFYARVAVRSLLH